MSTQDIAATNSQRDTDGLADTQLAASGELSGNPASYPAALRQDSEDRGRAAATAPTLDSHDPQRAPGRSRSQAHERVLPIDRQERYTVLGEHGRGGLGRVLKARDERIGRIVAIKELIGPSSFAESLFVREALITARLQHPGIVPVHEAGRWPSGDPYYVMKLVAGNSLQALIDSKKTLSERMELLPHVIDVVETIAYAHSQGVIHRDIKPANVLVGDFGETVVVDWGLARDEEHPVLPVKDLAQAEFSPPGKEPGDGSVWQVSGNYSVSGKIVGTPAYMPPEQARGDDVDMRADVYSLGALLYEVLSGARLYSGSDLGKTLDAVLAGPPVPLAERLARSDEAAPPDLVAIVDKAIARDPGDRYPSARELAEDLRRFHTGKLVSAHEYSPWSLLRRWIMRNRAPVLVGLASLLLLAGLAVVSVNRVVAAKNLAERERAQAIESQRAAEDSRNKIVLLQAEASLDNDPTATVAWLKQAPIARYFSRARALFTDAVARGVSRHVLLSESAAWYLAALPDNHRALAYFESGELRLIDATTGNQSLVFRVPSAGLPATAASGMHAATATSDGRIRLFDLTGTGDSPRVMTRAAGELKNLFLTADGATLLAERPDGGLEVWDTGSAALQYTVDLPRGHKVFSPDGTRVSVAQPDGEMVILDVMSQRERARVPLPAPALLVCFAPDNRHLAVLDAHRAIHLIDIDRAAVQTLGTGVPFMSGMNPLAFSPKSRWLAFGDAEWAIHLWNVETGEHRLMRGHENSVFSLSFSADETTLASASDDGTARIWDIGSTHVQVLRGHTDDVIRVALSPDGRTAFTASIDGSLRIWPLSEPYSVRLSGHDHPLVAAKFSPRGDVVTLAMSGAIHRRDPVTGGKHQIAAAQPGVISWNTGLSPDGRFAIVPNPRANTIDIWDIGQETRRTVAWRGDITHAIAFAPDSKAATVLSKSGVATVLWLDAATAPQVFQREDVACGAAMAPGGAQLAIVYPGRADIMELPSGRTISSIDLSGNERCIHDSSMIRISARYSPDGRWLALAYAKDGTILLWDSHAQTLRRFAVSHVAVGHLCFSPDSSLLASAHHDRSFHLLHITGGEHRELGRHRDAIWDIQFSPDGKTMATSSYDHEVRLWDTRSGEWRTLRGHSASVPGIAFSADGRHLASASEDRTLRIWDTGDPVPDAAALGELLGTTTTAIISPDDRVRTP